MLPVTIQEGFPLRAIPLRIAAINSTVGDTMHKGIWAGTIVAIVLLLVGWYVVVTRHVRFGYGGFSPGVKERLRIDVNLRRTLLRFRYIDNWWIWLSWDSNLAGPLPTPIPHSGTGENEVTASESLTHDRVGNATRTPAVLHATSTARDPFTLDLRLATSPLLLPPGPTPCPSRLPSVVPGYPTFAPLMLDRPRRQRR
jgi:hypothetical protein